MNPQTTPSQPSHDKITKVEMFNSIVATLANTVVEETLKDASVEEQMSEAIRIAKDAESETPESEIGKQVRTDAIRMIEKYESGELRTKPNQWANDQRNATTNVAVVDILQIIAKNATKLVFNEDMTQAQANEQMDVFDSIAKEVLQIITDRKVPLRDDGYLFDQLAYVIGMLKGPVLDAISARKEEVLARAVGTRNPHTEKYDATQITYGDLVSSLDTLRESTGKDDYFIGNEK